MRTRRHQRGGRGALSVGVSTAYFTSPPHPESVRAPARSLRKPQQSRVADPYPHCRHTIKTVLAVPRRRDRQPRPVQLQIQALRLGVRRARRNNLLVSTRLALAFSMAFGPGPVSTHPLDQGTMTNDIVAVERPKNLG